MTRARWLLTVVLAILVAAAAVLTVRLAADDEVVEGTRPVLAEDGTYTVGTVLGEPSDALAAAVAAVPAALSYDYANLEASLVAATSRMTEDFAAEFRTTFEASVRPLAVQKQAVSEAQVRAAGVVSSSDAGNTVVCLVYVDQVLVSSKELKASDQPVKIGQTRVSVRLVRVGDSWKVDDLQPV